MSHHLDSIVTHYLLFFPTLPLNLRTIIVLALLAFDSAAFLWLELLVLILDECA
jgi:hypothetical protein